MTKVKICGITNLADARLAVEMGADSLGFNFYEESPRYISPDMARQIIEELPGGIEKVGVFVNRDPTDILGILKTTGLNAAQLHGDETLSQIRELRAGRNLKLIKAFRVGPNFEPGFIDGFPVDSILLDAYSKDVYGGTGESFEWRIAAVVSSKGSPLYLAGGLSPENVADAIRTVRPYAVDVASGVEITPRRKDPAKVEAFIANAKNA